MARTPARPDGATWNRLLMGAVPFSGTFLRQVKRGAVQDVGLRDLDGAEAEEQHRLEQDRGAGDDRRRAVRVQAGDLLALRERERGELAEHALDRFDEQAVAVDSVGVVWIEVLIDRGERGRGAGDRDALRDARAHGFANRVGEARAER